MINMAPSHPNTNMHLGTSANSAAPRNALLQWCYSKHNLGASGKNPQIASDPDSMEVDSVTKGKSTGEGKTSTVERPSPWECGRKLMLLLWHIWTLGGRLAETWWRCKLQLQQRFPQRQRQSKGSRADEQQFWPESLFGSVISVSSVTDCKCHSSGERSERQDG